MEEIIYQHDYTQYKQELRTELEKTSEGFVRIGYLLKVARDTDILIGSGYKDYLDFANGEFGLDKSMVSRFIRINDRFSEEGNSDRLLEQYKGFGYAKLAIMLRIPEVITEELTPEYTKSEIQAIKNEIDEERSKSEVEHLEENFEQIMNPPTDSLLVRVLKAIGEDNAALFCKIWNFFSENVEWGGLKDIFKPIDQQTYVTRVAGEGKIILIVKDEGAALTIARSEQKTNHSWNEINSAWAEIMPVSNGQEGHSFTEAKDAYEFTYGKPIEEEKPEVAPVQPKRVEVPKKPKKSEPNKYVKEVEEVKRAEKEPDPEPKEEPAAEPQVEEVSGEVVEEPKPTANPAKVTDLVEALQSDIKTLERMLREENYKAFKSKLASMNALTCRLIDMTEAVEE